MNTEIQKGSVVSATPLTPRGPLQLEARGQLFRQAAKESLQAASSEESPKTMSMEIGKGLAQSPTPFTPNGPLQG